MVDTPQILQLDSQLTAVIRFTIPRTEMQTVMGPAITEVMEAVAAQGVGPAGPVFAHHFRMSPGTFDFEVGVPVSAPFAPVGRVTQSQFPATTVARTVYYGAYDGISDGWAWFGTWIATARYTAAPDLWEVYLVGPESSPKPIYWRTELNRPLTTPG